jgi:heme a synthase
MRFSAFQKAALTTTALTYFLIAVGAFVRVTGAGMGCPDWPKCFGLWVPPTHASQLPPGYDASEFSATLTWIEYLNRLLGVLVGLSILLTLLLAIVQHRRRRSVWLPSLCAFVGVLFAGWLGSRVVAHELAPWIVTEHLFSALLVVSALVLAVAWSRVDVVAIDVRTLPVLGVAVLQGALGTQVRGTLEDVARRMPGARGAWIDGVGALDDAHRALSIFVVLGCLWLWRARSTWASRAAVGLCAFQAALGVVLVWMPLPRPAQVLHLLCAALLIGALTVHAVLAERR